MINRPGGFGKIQLRAERDGDAAGDLVLHGEQIARVAVEALGPHMHVGISINELSVDANLVPGSTYTSFQHIAHAQLSADLLRVYRLLLIGERAVARDHEQARDP